MSPNRNRKKLEGSLESSIEAINDYLSELRDFRNKALRDYNEVRRNTNDNAERVVLETIRANTFKSFENYQKLYLDALKLHSAVAIKLSDKDKKADKEADEMLKITRTDKKDIKELKSKILKELEEEKRNLSNND